MPALLDNLDPRFRAKVQTLIEAVKAKGCEMRPYNGLRTPLEQARFWRQSRSIEEIEAKIAQLKKSRAPFLAQCIEEAGPQNGGRITNAPPGLSWHQWGEAVDCFWVVNSAAEWSIRKRVNDRNGYETYAAVAKSIGLTAGGFFKSLKDWPHVQLREAGSPLSAMSMVEINDEMERRFGSTNKVKAFAGSLKSG